MLFSSPQDVASHQPKELVARIEGGEWSGKLHLGRFEARIVLVKVCCCVFFPWSGPQAIFVACLRRGRFAISFFLFAPRSFCFSLYFLLRSRCRWWTSRVGSRAQGGTACRATWPLAILGGGSPRSKLRLVLFFPSWSSSFLIWVAFFYGCRNIDKVGTPQERRSCVMFSQKSKQVCHHSFGLARWDTLTPCPLFDHSRNQPRRIIVQPTPWTDSPWSCWRGKNADVGLQVTPSDHWCFCIRRKCLEMHLLPRWSDGTIRMADDLESLNQAIELGTSQCCRQKRCASDSCSQFQLLCACLFYFCFFWRGVLAKCVFGASVTLKYRLG